MRKVQMLALIPLLATQGCGLFAAARPTVTTNAAGCSSLIPNDWQDGVAGAPLPDGKVVGDYIVFGDQQTGKLDQANGRTRDTISIISRCEARDKAALAKRSRFLGTF